MKTRKAYKFRIFPTKAQTTKIEFTLRLCRELYNAALQERRDAYRMNGKSLNYYDQADQLSSIKEERTDLSAVHSQVLQDVLRRVDKAFGGFFGRLKRGVKAGFPRFQGRNRYDSFTYPQSGWSVKNNLLTLSKIGTIRMNLHREVIGKVKTCTIRRDGLAWFVCFSVEYEYEQPKHEGPVVGIDVGLENFANLSNGKQIANPRLFRKAEKHLAKVQRKAAKLRHLPRFNRCKIIAKRNITRAYRRVKFQRLDFAHKLSAKLSKEYSLIAVEDLNIRGLASGILAKSVNDAGWSLFLQLLAVKA